MRIVNGLADRRVGRKLAMAGMVNLGGQARHHVAEKKKLELLWDRTYILRHRPMALFPMSRFGGAKFNQGHRMEMLE
jgi:hypothetical protein